MSKKFLFFLSLLFLFPSISYSADSIFTRFKGKDASFVNLSTNHFEANDVRANTISAGRLAVGTINWQNLEGVELSEKTITINNYIETEGLSPKGAWSPSTPYLEGNIVTSGGSSWVALRDNLNVTPVNGLDWWIIAEKGTNGVNGEVGATGAKGDKGDKGDTGEVGPQGLQGDIGPQGPEGLAGVGISTGSDGSYGWLTLSNTTTFSPCAAGYYGLTFVGGSLKQCANGVLSDIQTGSSGTATSLSAQYIDWNSSSGGNSIANKPDLTGKLLESGTDGTYGWTTSTNTESYSDCQAGDYGLNWIGGNLYQCKNGTNSLFTSGGSSTTINALTDVSLSSPANGNILTYNGSTWYNNTTYQTRIDALEAKVAALIALNGGETKPVFSLSPTSKAYGNVEVGQTPTQIFTLTNTGLQDAASLNLAFSTGTIFTNTATTCGSSLASLASCTFTTRFAPIAATSYSDTITISATGATNATVALSGTGTAQQQASCATTPYVDGSGTDSAPSPVANSSTGNTYNGVIIASGTSSTPLCRVDFNIAAVFGDISTYTYQAEIWSLTGTTLTTRLYTSATKSGANVAAGWNSFTFDNASIAGDVAVVLTKTDHTSSSSNYITLVTTTTNTTDYFTVGRWAAALTAASTSSTTDKEVRLFTLE